MNNNKQLFADIADEYSLMLLNWAYKKLGDRDKAEDLAQEVLVQVFIAISKSSSAIEKPDNFIWKIAHYTWCNYLRKNEHYKLWISSDELELQEEYDFATDFAEKEEKNQFISNMRRQISRLNYLQREIIVSFYIDNKSIKDIAEKYNISQSAVKWHLFNTRNSLKKEIEEMKTEEYVYRPRELHMGISGQAVPMPDIKFIEHSLTKQNICILCYNQPKTKKELAECLGIPMAYIESDLAWLVEKEFVSETKGKYATTFLITDKSQSQEEYAIYLKYKKDLSDVIVNGLISAEDKIRDIGFYGSDKPMNKLLWLLIYRFCDYQKIPVRATWPPVRPDGGKYFPLGFDVTETEDVDIVLDRSDWAYNGSMYNDNYSWFGLYNFGTSEIEDMMDEYTGEWKNLHALLNELIYSDYDISAFDENKKYELAKLVQKGFISIKENRAYPNFCIFTKEQTEKLEQTVFQPISEKLDNVLLAIKADFVEYSKNKLPEALKGYYDYFIRNMLMDIAFVTTILAFNDDKLYKPKDSSDGEFLTLMYEKE